MSNWITVQRQCVETCCIEWLGQIFPRLEYNQQRKTGRQEARGLAMPPSLLLQVIIVFSLVNTNTNTLHSSTDDVGFLVIVRIPDYSYSLWLSLTCPIWALMSVFSDVSLVVVNNTQTNYYYPLSTIPSLTTQIGIKLTLNSRPTCRILIGVDQTTKSS